MNRKSARGFTMIEMLIVLVVISIILGVVMPNLRGTQDEASIQRAKADLQTVATAIESYYIHHSNTLPTTLADLITATPRIINVVPDDPFRAGSTDYTYARDTSGIYYVVYAYGPDRARDITGIGTTGRLTGTNDDDIYMTNGTGF